MKVSTQDLKQAALVFLGAAIGGVVGSWGFFWLIQQGFYGLVLPGGLLGLGAGLGRTRFPLVAVICGVAALALGVFCEWRGAPFIADASLGYFLQHLQNLQPLTLIMIVAGGAIGFWVPFRRGRGAR